MLPMFKDMDEPELATPEHLEFCLGGFPRKLDRGKAPSELVVPAFPCKEPKFGYDNHLLLYRLTSRWTSDYSNVSSFNILE